MATVHLLVWLKEGGRDKMRAHQAEWGTGLLQAWGASSVVSAPGCSRAPLLKEVNTLAKRVLKCRYKSSLQTPVTGSGSAPSSVSNWPHYFSSLGVRLPFCRMNKVMLGFASDSEDTVTSSLPSLCHSTQYMTPSQKWGPQMGLPRHPKKPLALTPLVILTARVPTRP